MRKTLFHIGLYLYILFGLFFVKAYFFPDWMIELKSPYIEKEMDVKLSSEPEGIHAKVDSTNSNKDTAKVSIQQPKGTKGSTPTLFTTSGDSSKRILFIGDSQLENLRFWVRKSLMDNNYQLAGSVIWYGSSTKQWASTDTLEYFYKKFKPDFILIALGLNELFVNDLEKRASYSKIIKYKLAQLGVPYYFIGPAAWVKDKGSINVIQGVFGELFYPSHLLKLDRAADGRHPSKSGAKSWFKEVAQKMTEKNVLNLRISKDTTYAGNSPTILLKVPSE
jgi:hypothetical protein